jgi:glycosyltransferase involved in cell wall biosynthesis
MERGELAEIIFVDDGSRDATPQVVAKYPAVRVLNTGGRGAAAARNTGWRAASGEIIWFLDSDCDAQPDNLANLRRHLDDPKVAAVGGSLLNGTPDSLLACLVHEEIVARHAGMPARVNFLATGNVLYRRVVLEQMNGFDELFRKGEDADLAWRVHEAGYELAFEHDARVAHHYYVRLGPYLRAQRREGFWRVFLHLGHRGHAAGDSYSNLLDHMQPPLAMLTLAALAFAVVALFLRGAVAKVAGGMALLMVVLLIAAHIPMALRLVRRTSQWRFLTFALMSSLRSIYRGIGLTHGVMASLLSGWRLSK